MSTGLARSGLARSGLKAASALADRFRPADEGIVILIYHRVGHGAGEQMDIDPGVFRTQLAWLSDRTRVLSLADALVELGGAAPVEPGVVLTFDDGTDDWLTNVLPLLDSFSLPATFYVATDFVERSVPFPLDGRPISWSGLVELAASPLVTIGSHTHTHRLMDRIEDEVIAEELDTSIDLLGSHLGRAPKHFCYPKAVLGSPAAERAIAARFASATIGGNRPNTAGVNPYRLTRSPIQRSDGMAWFEAKAHGGMWAEDALRRGVNSVRHRNATS